MENYAHSLLLATTVEDDLAKIQDDLFNLWSTGWDMNTTE